MGMGQTVMVIALIVVGRFRNIAINQYSRWQKNKEKKREKLHLLPTSEG